MREAGYDPDRLPPGQYLTEKWPVLHRRERAEGRPGHLGLLRITGPVEQPLRETSMRLRRCPARRSRRTCTASRAGRCSTALGGHPGARAKSRSSADADRVQSGARRAGFHRQPALASCATRTCSSTAATGSRSSPSTAGRCASCPARTSGRARSGCAASSSRRPPRILGAYGYPSRRPLAEERYGF